MRGVQNTLCSRTLFALLHVRTIYHRDIAFVVAYDQTLVASDAVAVQCDADRWTLATGAGFFDGLERAVRQPHCTRARYCKAGSPCACRHQIFFGRNVQ